MLITAELLLHFQRCSRRAFLDVYHEDDHRDPPSDYLLKLLQDSNQHRQKIWQTYSGEKPLYPPGDWVAGGAATYQMMQQGVEYIRQGVMALQLKEDLMLLSCPDLLIKCPGASEVGDWLYAPLSIKLGKRPKLEYQIGAAFDVHVLAAFQGAWPEQAWLVLREKGVYEVDLWKVLPQMQEILADCLKTLQLPEAPDVFIARSRCNLCHWFSSCYQIAQEQAHLSLLPGVTPTRYVQLQAVNLTTVEALAEASPKLLEPLAGFGREVAEKMVFQAQATWKNMALRRPEVDFDPIVELPSHAVELYFDIEAEPDLNLAYLLGVMVVDRQAQTERFYPLLAETPSEENQVWWEFLSLVEQYPQAPIYHFCPYEAHTIDRLGELYAIPKSRITPILNRCVDLHDRVTRAVTLPVESYALKHIARWLGFDWRDASANGAQTVFWYAQWLETGDRRFLAAIVDYNEDDCRAMYHLKNWLLAFLG